MRFAAVFLFVILLMPVVVDVRLYADDNQMIRGYLLFSLYGFSFRLPIQIEKKERFYLKFGSTHRIKIHVDLKKRKKLPVISKSYLKSWGENVLFQVDLRIGLYDACSTALCCGLLQMIFDVLPRTKARIQPMYHCAGYFLQVRCIAVFRLGKLFLTAALFFAGRSAGGRQNGNIAKQANQLRHADGP